MKTKSITPQDAIALLNEASMLDPVAIRALVGRRVPCNYQLADHPTILVGVSENGDPEIGVLGIINGLFGFDANVHGVVIAEFPDDPAEPVMFSLNPNFEE
jgi:hypothetical protein